MAFSSNPQLSRPDILTLRDDKGMISDDHVVPVVRAALLRRYGRPLRRRLNAASALLSTLELRGLNQQVIDGRLPEAVGGEFADANGLGGRTGAPRGPRIRSASSPSTRTRRSRTSMRGAARRGLPRQRRADGGLRPETVSALRRGRIDLWPGYSGRCSATWAARP